MSLKIGLLGPGGQLGTSLRVLLPQAIPLFKSQIDFLKPTSIQGALGEGGFTHLINCAALCDVDYCESNESEAITVNATAVRDVARYGAGRNIHLIHISTDYVFDGLKGSAYASTDETNPLNVYG